VKFSLNEVKDLVFAWVLLSIAFAVLFRNMVNSVVLGFWISTLTAGIGFVLHEVMHKYVAQKYGLWAEFKAFYGGLFLAIGIAFFGFIFAAPGAVMIHGFITKERNGKIALAGPVTNLVLALLFLGLMLVSGSGGTVGLIYSFGFRINALLAAFNMIPAGPFDGAKVMAWDKKIFYVIGLIAVGLFLLSWFV
jgi:Zn-dependent protease